MKFESPDPGVPTRTPAARRSSPSRSAMRTSRPFRSRCGRRVHRADRATAAAFSTATAAGTARTSRCARITSRTTRTPVASGRAPAERTIPIVTATWWWGHTSSSARAAPRSRTSGPHLQHRQAHRLFCPDDAWCHQDYPHCRSDDVLFDQCRLRTLQICQLGGNVHPVAMCNGPLLTEFTGTYGGGSSVLNLPVSIDLSIDPGPDTLYCTGDDPKDPVLCGAHPE